MKSPISNLTIKNSIRARLIGYFMLVILISVLAFETLLIYFTRYYFYKNVEGMLTNQIKISSDFYFRYFSNVPLETNIIDNVDIFWKQTAAQVQILNPSGKILMDSTGYSNKGNVTTSDFLQALNGYKGKWIGYVNYDKSRVMIISYPLKSGDNIVGVIRFIASLKDVDRTVLWISTMFIAIGASVIFVAGLVSLFLARSIILPLKEVTDAAKKMAGGNLKVRIEKRHKDEIGLLADTLNFMVQEIEKREEIKNQFISSVSHELRTPLTSIKGWAITLNTGECDKDLLMDGLRIIEKESDRLSGMVEELLDFSRLISGKSTLSRKHTNIKNIIDYIHRYMLPRAEREGIAFTIQCKDDLPLLDLDENKIKQVLINIIDNAIKFTPSDGGHIVLKAFTDDKKVIISLQDNGCGINEEDLPRVKERFYKGKNSKSQTGLGLSICDEIVRMHGGTLDIESKVNIGTTIYVKLPYNKEAHL